MHGNGQAAQVTPTTRTFITTRILLINNFLRKQDNEFTKELVKLKSEMSCPNLITGNQESQVTLPPHFYYFHIGNGNHRTKAT